MSMFVPDQRAAWRKIALKHSDDMFLAFDEHMNPEHHPAFTMDGCLAAIAEAVALSEAKLAAAERKLAEIEKFCDLAQSFSATYQRERILAIVRGEK